MTRSLVFVGTVMLLVSAGFGARAAEPTPEEIINKAVSAHSGDEKLAGLSGFTMKEQLTYEGTPPWDVEIAVQHPGRYRRETKINSEGKSRTTMIVLDGEHGWMKMNDVVTPYPSAFLTTMQKYTVPYLGPRSVLRLRARQKNSACRFSTAGECTVDGRPAIGVRMKIDGGPEETWYFDKESGLLLKEEQRTKRFEGEDEVLVTLFGDYETCDGFPIARKVTSQRDGKPLYTQKMVEFKVGTPSESTFAKP